MVRPLKGGFEPLTQPNGVAMTKFYYDENSVDKADISDAAPGAKEKEKDEKVNEVVTAQLSE